AYACEASKSTINLSRTRRLGKVCRPRDQKWWLSLPLSSILWSRTRCIAPFFLHEESRMVFSYPQVKEHPKLLLAMTALSHAEFHQWLPHFQYAWDQYVQQHYVDRDDRQRQYGAGRSEATLVHIEDKLLFILYDVKVYPLQEMLAFEF